MKLVYINVHVPDDILSVSFGWDIYRTVPDHYELPEWAQHRLAALMLVPACGAYNGIVVPELGEVTELTRRGPEQRMLYTIYVPDEYADMWGELI